MYREALRCRRESAAMGEGPMEWLTESDDLLAIRRTGPDGTQVISVINLGDQPALLPPEWGGEVLIASGPDVASLSTDGDPETHGHAGPGQASLAIGPETAIWLGATS
jgi:hypothetical protein